MNTLALKNQIFSVKNDADFLATAIAIFDFQKHHCSVYAEYLAHLGKTNLTVTSLEEIPFLPISFFKTHEIISDGMSSEVLFKSSGTGGDRSQHFVANSDLYAHTFERIYRDQIGAPEDQVILALLPNYIQQGNSSLVYMVERLIDLSTNQHSGFYLENLPELIQQYNKAVASGKKVVLFGVSYALLDLAALHPDLSEATIIETGGMKGRRAEMSKAELHETLKRGLNCGAIASEYGMTELLSQGYSQANGIFQPGITMRILIREVNDPYGYISGSKTGGINIVDLANLYSCSFIETQDLGKMYPNGFEIMGRFDHSDIRGCNLMIE